MSEHAGKMLSQGGNMSFNLGTCCVKLGTCKFKSEICYINWKMSTAWKKIGEARVAEWIGGLLRLKIRGAAQFNKQVNHIIPQHKFHHQLALQNDVNLDICKPFKKIISKINMIPTVRMKIKAPIQRNIILIDSANP